MYATTTSIIIIIGHYHHQVRNTTAIFIINLSVSDLLFGCFNMPLAASIFITRRSSSASSKPRKSSQKMSLNNHSGGFGVLHSVNCFHCYSTHSIASQVHFLLVSSLLIIGIIVIILICMIVIILTRLPLHYAHSARIQWTDDDDRIILTEEIWFMLS